LPAEMKARLLRTTCKGIDPETSQEIEYSCPVGDANAVANANVTVPHSFAGLWMRENFIKAEWNDSDKKYKADRLEAKRALMEK